MDVFPPGIADAAPVSGVGRRTRALAAVAGHPVARQQNAPELLDVDVDELARTLALVALGRLEPESAEAAHPDPGQDSRDGRLRHPQHLSDLGTGHAQTPQAGDHLDPVLVSAVVDALWCRRA